MYLILTMFVNVLKKKKGEKKTFCKAMAMFVYLLAFLCYNY
uniref:Uncharacterized protein n=1 Tax=Anguilla anguilla TaxID=7936 RepID=A0A0E9WRI6_ANGAN